jgi:hypothetical protein
VVYNIISCGGFETTAGGWIAGGGCLKARIGLIILFFLIAVIRRWGAEEIGLDFSFLLALVGGLGSYFLLITFFGSFKLAAALGILIALICGYGGGMFFGGEGGE